MYLGRFDTAVKAAVAYAKFVEAQEVKAAAEAQEAAAEPQEVEAAAKAQEVEAAVEPQVTEVTEVEDDEAEVMEVEDDECVDDPGDVEDAEGPAHPPAEMVTEARGYDFNLSANECTDHKSADAPYTVICVTPQRCKLVGWIRQDRLTAKSRKYTAFVSPSGGVFYSKRKALQSIGAVSGKRKAIPNRRQGTAKQRRRFIPREESLDDDDFEKVEPLEVACEEASDDGDAAWVETHVVDEGNVAPVAPVAHHPDLLSLAFLSMHTLESALANGRMRLLLCDDRNGGRFRPAALDAMFRTAPADVVYRVCPHWRTDAPTLSALSHYGRRDILMSASNCLYTCNHADRDGLSAHARTHQSSAAAEEACIILAGLCEQK